MRAAEHYRHSDPRKAIAHFGRALALRRYPAFGSHVTPVSLRVHEDYWLELPKRATYAPCVAELVGMHGGVAEYAYREYTACEKAKIPVKIATVVASNSGRPGGACRAPDGSVEYAKIHAHHKTQEEDVISSWLTAETAALSSPDQRRAMMNSLFDPVSKAFGLSNPRGTDTRTIQHVDYTRGNAVDVRTGGWGVRGPRVYADAWLYEGATMCEKRIDAGVPVFDTDRTYQTTLVFCSAPNAQDPTLGRTVSMESSMRRTYSQKANRDRDYFDTGVAWAVYTALYASALAGCDTVILPFVGGGVYAGPHKKRLDIKEFQKTVDSMLKGRLPDGTRVPRLESCFRSVVIVVIPPRTSYGGVGANVGRGLIKTAKMKNSKSLKRSGECAVCFEEDADLQLTRDKRNFLYACCPPCRSKLKATRKAREADEDPARSLGGPSLEERRPETDDDPARSLWGPSLEERRAREQDEDLARLFGSSSLVNRD